MDLQKVQREQIECEEGLGGVVCVVASLTHGEELEPGADEIEEESVAHAEATVNRGREKYRSRHHASPSNPGTATSPTTSRQKKSVGKAATMASWRARLAGSWRERRHTRSMVRR